jgi:putative transposase
MARQPRQVAESGIHHVMLRGVNRDAVFLEEADYKCFLHFLVLVKAASGCRVLAYCLMTNHVHLVVRVTNESVGNVIKRLGVRYVGWFNKKYGRVGHLFQSRFASLPVEDGAYLAALIRYVWNNPVAAGLADASDRYRWSSRHLLGHASPIVDEDALRELFSESELNELATGPAPTGDDVDAVEMSQSGPTAAQTARLLVRACGR